jgi:hypothetical protein
MFNDFVGPTDRLQVVVARRAIYLILRGFTQASLFERVSLGAILLHIPGSPISFARCVSDHRFNSSTRNNLINSGFRFMSAGGFSNGPYGYILP